MKKLVSLFLGICIFVVNTIVPLAADDVSEVGYLNFATDFMYIQSGTEVVSPVYEYQPSEADTSTLVWYSDNESVASVKDGMIFVNEEGAANIYVYNQSGTRLDSIQVNVGSESEDNLTVITSVTLFESEISLQVGEECELDYSFSPKRNGDVCSLFWISDNQDVATAKDGIITAVGGGSAKISAVTLYGDVLAEMTVNVGSDENIEGGDDVVIEQGIVFCSSDGVQISEVTLNVGEEYYFSYYATSEGMDTSSVYLYSSDGQVAELYDGSIYAVGEGTAYIIAATSDGVQVGSLTVYVSGSGEGDDKPGTEEGGDDVVTEQGIVFCGADGEQISEVTLNVGEEYYFSYYATSEMMDTSSLYFSSSDGQVAEVYDGSRIYAVGEGTAYITVQTSDGVQVGSLTVYVNGSGEGDDKPGTEEGGDKNILITYIELNKNYSDLVIGNGDSLWTSVYPSDATNQNIIWTSANKAVATVDEWGNVNAVGVGETVIRATAADGSGVYAECVVNVKSDKLTQIILNKTSLDMLVGNYDYLYVQQYIPDYAVNQNVIWTSSNRSIVTVSEWGELYAAAEGTATIRATAADGSGVYAECVVNVMSDKVTGVMLNKNSVEISINEYVYLEATVLPAFAANQNVTWSTEDTDIISLNNYGRVKGLKEGTATVTVTTEDGGFTDTCIVTVKKFPVTGLTLSVDGEEKYESELFVNKYLYIDANIQPSNATNKNVTWSTENTDIISLTGSGRVKGLKEGTATVTATTEDGGYSKTFTVNVKKKSVTGITMTDTEIYLASDSNYYLYANVLPYDATNTSITWSSSDETIATVSSWGEVTAKKAGNTVITATTIDGGFEASCNVCVLGSVAQKSIGILQGEAVKAAFLFNNSVTFADISYSSADETIAKIDDNGNIIGVGEGTTTVTAQYEYGTYTYSMSHKVKVIPTSGNLTETISWTLGGEDYSVLTISGTGETPDVQWNEKGPFGNFNMVKEIVFEEGITGIGEYGFRASDLPNVTKLSLPDSLTTIGAVAFCDLKLDELVIPQGVTTIGISAFTRCGAKKVTIKGSLETIERSALYFPYLEELIIDADNEVGLMYLPAWYGADDESYAYDDASGHMGAGISVVITDNVELFNTGLEWFSNSDDWYKPLNIKEVTVGKKVKTFNYLQTASPEVTFYWNSEAGASLPMNSGYASDVHDVIEYDVLISDNVENIPEKFAYSYAEPSNVLNYVSMGSGIKTIGNEAFYNCDKLTSIVIPEAVTYIGHAAFGNCDNLNNITWNAKNAECYKMPNSVGGGDYYPNENTVFSYTGSQLNVVFGDSCEVIPEKLFCKDGWYEDGKADIASLMLGNSVKAIKTLAFAGQSNITEVNFPDSLEIIEVDAFKGCPITSLHITKGLKSFSGAFDSVQTYTLSDENEYFVIENGILYNKEKTWLIKCISNTDKAITIPDTVTVIEQGAFKNNTTLEEITLGKNISQLGKEAFYGCSALKKINWNTVTGTANPSDVFEGAGASDGVEIRLGSEVEKLPEYAFANLNIKKLVVDKSLKEVGYGAFYNCPTIELICYYGNANEWYAIDFNGTSYYYNRFILNYIDTVNENGYDYYIKDDEAYVTNYTGQFNGEEEFIIPSTLGGKPIVEIKDAFNGTEGEVGTIIIPDGVKRIVGTAFCSISAKKVVIPKSVEIITNYAFLYCDNLTEFEVADENKAYTDENGVLFNKGKTVLLAYPIAKAGIAYTVPDSVKTIGYMAFAKALNLKNIDLGASVETIRESAFEGCVLETLMMPASVTDIEVAAFVYSQIANVDYEGTEERRNFININNLYELNEPILNAAWSYGTVQPDAINLKMNAAGYYSVQTVGVEAGTQMLVSYYTADGEFVSLATQTYDGTDNLSFDIIEGADYAKVMMWKSIDSMMPVCSSKTAVFPTNSTN